MVKVRVVFAMAIIACCFLISASEDTDCTDKAVADIVFLVDSSESIGINNFRIIIDFLRHLVNGFDVAPDHVHIGMVQYSNILLTEFKLNTYKNKEEVLNHIDRLQYLLGQTDTGHALDFIRKDQFVESAGSRARENVPQIAVVITDGQATDSVTQPAIDLKNQKVIIFAIGIKDYVESELREIASPPAEQHVFSVSDFSALQGISKKIVKVLCETVEEALTLHPALPSSTLPPLSPTIHLPPTSPPLPCPTSAHPPPSPLPRPSPPPQSPPKHSDDCIQNEKADIYFLIDHSTSILDEDFQRVKRFIWEFSSLFHIGPQKVRVGLVKFSNSPKLEFRLSQYTDRKTLENAVIAVHQTGGDTYIGHALDFMSLLFRVAKEERPEVPKYLIVITDANSHDQVQEPAMKLRQLGIIIYAIGVKGANEAELVSICEDPKRKYFVHNYDDLRPIKDDIVKDICPQAACKNMQADIIFLLDGSGSINAHEFRKMKTFINRLVQQSLEMRPDAVRVGLLQFSGDFREEFPLSRQQTISGFVQTVNFVQQLGGVTLTGQALSLIPRYFDTSKGGRPNVPNILVVLTDGEAQDNVLRPAKHLRDSNIITYSVGFEDVNVTQLLEISGGKKRMFIETHFNALQLMESEIKQELCQPDAPDNKKEDKPEKQKCDKQQADLVLLTDSSGSIRHTDFLLMKSFMKNLVSSLDIKPDAVRVALVQFSHEPRKEFFFNEVDNEEDAKERIDAILQINSTTNIGMALDFTRNELFKASSGSRKEQGVSQNLILITDGYSTDNVSTAAEALRAMDVEVFVIGIGIYVHRDELIQIAGSESRVFAVHDFDVLDQIKTTLIQTVCEPADKHKTIIDVIKDVVTQATAVLTSGPINQETEQPTAAPVKPSTYRLPTPIHPRPAD